MPTGLQFPPLSAGGRLTADEFVRRYEQMPDAFHAELVEGVVYPLEPASAEEHGEPQFDLVGWLGVYRAHTPRVRGGTNCTLLLDALNVPQPDGYLRLLTEFGGQSRLAGGYVRGAPELIVEVTACGAS